MDCKPARAIAYPAMTDAAPRGPRIANVLDTVRTRDYPRLGGRKKMLAEVKRGDGIVTTGGIYGRVINVDGDDLTVEIAKGINIKMVRSGISEKTDSGAAEGKSKGGG